ncbi:acyl carrier protein [Actinomadura violacea]|uniref:Acyl carrier protein n=1 Tax=Actinomadura violacea TaxID=2819934 RepID=A0ABS3RNJ1_9ACTN|nr:acyl carrier protein [Actinomadura violacea]MBO2458325.1 acyl carrier protein [Actinomadura violacea]
MQRSADPIVRAQVRAVIAEILELEPEEITPDGLFREDHGADSMTLIDILGSLEKEFDVAIGEGELTRMVNLDGVLAVLTDAGLAGAAAPDAGAPR